MIYEATTLYGPALQVTENDVPDMFANITVDGTSGIPDDLETDTFHIHTFLVTNPELPCSKNTVAGRAGLVDWYVQNVGHDPHKYAGGPIAIRDLLEWVCTHLLLRADAALRVGA